jgi:predicted DNA-binding transcriptional regulator AlpA
MAAAPKLVQASPARLLSPKEASEFLGVPENTLAQWRSQRRGPVFIKLEERMVRYRMVDLDSYISARIVNPLEGALD